MVNAQGGSRVGPIRWDVLPQPRMCTKEIASALFLSHQAEELKDMSGGVTLLFLLAGTGTLLSEHGQGCPFSCSVQWKEGTSTKQRCGLPFRC